MSALEDMRAAVLAAPGDLDVRRVYADALQQDEDPRGEWIALCCAAEHPEGVDAEMRRRALWQAYGHVWREADLGVLEAKLAWRISYQHGFVHTINTGIADVIELAPRLAEQPLHALLVGAIDPASAAALAQLPVMKRIRRLELGYGLDTLSVDDVVGVIRAAPNLRELAFTPHQHAPLLWEALRRLGDEGRLAGIAELELRSITIGRDDAAWLVRSMPKLASLDTCYGLTPGGLDELAGSSLPLTSLRIMDRDGNYGRTRELDDDGIARLLRSPVIAKLSHLGLDSCPLGEASAEAFMQLPCAATLASLGLICLPRSHQVLDALGEATLPVLDRLNLWMCFASASSMAALARFRTLRSLHIGRNTLSADVVRRLVAALPQLETLSVIETSAGDAAIYAILESPCADTLRNLEMQVAEVTADGARALADSPLAPRLRELDLYGNKLGAPAVRVLAAAPFDRMAHLSVGDNMRGDTRPIFAADWFADGRDDHYERRLELSGKAVSAGSAKKPKPRAKPPEAPARSFDPAGAYVVGDRVAAGERGVGVVTGVEPTYIAVKFKTSGSLRWQRVPENAIGYSVKRRFATGEYVVHPTFGAGTVRSVTHDRVEIEFWNGALKTLVHGKA